LVLVETVILLLGHPLATIPYLARSRLLAGVVAHQVEHTLLNRVVPVVDQMEDLAMRQTISALRATPRQRLRLKAIKAAILEQVVQPLVAVVVVQVRQDKIPV
jgi:hypothetical protein